MELILFFLALAAVRPTGSDLPAPRNVHIDSYNMEHILRWEPGEAQGERLPVKYDVEFETYDHVQELCVNLTETRCNFTGRIQNFHRGRLKVRAQLGAERSDWTATQEFQGSRNTVIGPVKSLTLHPDVGGLTVHFLPPFPSIPSDWNMEYALHYRKKESPEEEVIKEYSSTTYKLKNLKPWTEYCVRVNVSTDVTVGRMSDPVCATTRGTDWVWPLVLAVFLLLFAITIVLFILANHSARIKNILQGSYSIPSHLQEYLEDPPFRNYVAETDLTSEEECDHISVVEADEESRGDHDYQGAEKT